LRLIVYTVIGIFIILNPQICWRGDRKYSKRVFGMVSETQNEIRRMYLKDLMQKTSIVI
jgi:hypothetical protein